MGTAPANKRFKNKIETLFSSDEILKLEDYAESKFKNCPFCGNQKTKLRIVVKKKDRVEYYCYCRCCPAKMATHVTYRLAKGDVDYVVQRWNYRKNEV